MVKDTLDREPGLEEALAPPRGPSRPTALMRLPESALFAAATARVLERKEEKKVSFSEAAGFFAKEGIPIDLENEVLPTAVQHYQLWEIDRSLKEAGVITDEKDIETLLSSATISESALHAMKELAQQGKSAVPVLVPPLNQDFGFVDLGRLILNRTPYRRGSRDIDCLRDASRLDPHDIPGLTRVDLTPYEVGLPYELNLRLGDFLDQLREKKGRPVENEPRLVLIPTDNLEDTTPMSALQAMQSVVTRGAKYIDPAAHWIYLMQQITSGLYGPNALDEGATLDERIIRAHGNETLDAIIPDNQRVTPYPDFVLPEYPVDDAPLGRIPCLIWTPNLRKFSLFSYSAGYKFSNGRHRVAPIAVLA